MQLLNKTILICSSLRVRPLCNWSTPYSPFWIGRTPPRSSRGTSPNVHATLQSRVNHHNPTTEPRGSLGRFHPPQAALPPNSLTTSATSSPETGKPDPESPGSTSSMEGMLMGLRNSPKYSVLSWLKGCDGKCTNNCKPQQTETTLWRREGQTW